MASNRSAVAETFLILAVAPMASPVKAEGTLLLEVLR
jgi:hypothetical protein